MRFADDVDDASEYVLYEPPTALPLSQDVQPPKVRAVTLAEYLHQRHWRRLTLGQRVTVTDPDNAFQVPSVLSGHVLDIIPQATFHTDTGEYHEAVIAVQLDHFDIPRYYPAPRVTPFLPATDREVLLPMADHPHASDHREMTGNEGATNEPADALREDLNTGEAFPLYHEVVIPEKPVHTPTKGVTDG